MSNFRSDNPFRVLTRSVVESEGTLRDFAGTPEGKLVMHALENCFAQTGERMRILRANERAREMNGEYPKPSHNKPTRMHSVMWLQYEVHWIMSDAYYPMSFRWCCEALFHDPEGAMQALRRRHQEILSGDEYYAPPKRWQNGDKRAA